MSGRSPDHAPRARTPARGGPPKASIQVVPRVSVVANAQVDWACRRQAHRNPTGAKALLLTDPRLVDAQEIELMPADKALDMGANHHRYRAVGSQGRAEAGRSVGPIGCVPLIGQ